ncbi:MAG: hypothetical protein H7096_06320 [Flavobacterium sp.]|nr:hypothetical protein [Pedobacter sp.]
MNRLIFSFCVLTLTFFWIYHTAASGYNSPVNLIIGDISYVKKFGHLPAPGTDKNLRIKTHLAYAEKLLRKSETSYMNPQMRKKRKKSLDHLHDYWVAGAFPKNYNRKVLSPCFIDKNGNICALGYLIEKSVSRQMAENINKEYKDHATANMNSAIINKWVKENGFSKEEAAIIQPFYDWESDEPAKNKFASNW